ncbi:hypothetical protein EJ110_NYTH60207, partial [Nymphaea thermarum]
VLFFPALYRKSETAAIVHKVFLSYSLPFQRRSSIHPPAGKRRAMDVALFSPSSLFGEDDDHDDDNLQHSPGVGTSNNSKSGMFVERSHSFPGMVFNFPCHFLF